MPLTARPALVRRLWLCASVALLSRNGCPAGRYANDPLVYALAPVLSSGAATREVNMGDGILLGRIAGRRVRGGRPGLRGAGAPRVVAGVPGWLAWTNLGLALFNLLPGAPWTAAATGGTVSVIGVYGGFVDKFPTGLVMNRSLTIRTGQCQVRRYMRPLLDRIHNREIDPSFVISHQLPVDEAPRVYEMFRDKEDACTKVVLRP
jgi:hypothetical protein